MAQVGMNRSSEIRGPGVSVILPTDVQGGVVHMGGPPDAGGREVLS